MNIGESTRLRIIELCREKGITINKLSTLCGITQSTLNNIICGRNKGTTVSIIKKICDGLEINTREFFKSKLFDDLDKKIKIN